MPSVSGTLALVLENHKEWPAKICKIPMSKPHYPLCYSLCHKKGSFWRFVLHNSLLSNAVPLFISWWRLLDHLMLKIADFIPSFRKEKRSFSHLTENMASQKPLHTTKYNSWLCDRKVVGKSMILDWLKLWKQYPTNENCWLRMTIVTHRAQHKKVKPICK